MFSTAGEVPAEVGKVFCVKLIALTNSGRSWTYCPPGSRARWPYHFAGETCQELGETRAFTFLFRAFPWSELDALNLDKLEFVLKKPGETSPYHRHYVTVLIGKELEGSEAQL